ncbi:MAG: PH domain-containing protein [Clostridium sp.]|nr:PH domain-containing protein [Clostridium sp.]MDU7084555.1 PH domain-containing protein [Clostridium sp.]
MLKKFAAEALGISDIGKILSPSDYNKVEADDYVMHEDDEKIYFLIKSRTDEYCFTNLALIHVDGTTAISSKKTLRRYDYYENQISNVFLETAGTVDLDAEIKFSIGQANLSIDVDKKQIEQLKDLYKTLIRIGQISRHNNSCLEFSRRSLEIATAVLDGAKLEGVAIEENFEKINNYAFNWQLESIKKYVVKDFGYVFEKYINN